VERDEHVVGRLDPQRLGGAAVPGQAFERHEAVDHRVAHELHPFLPHALRPQVLDRLLGVEKAEGREVVRRDAIRLLRHRAIEAAKPGLHMTDRYAHLLGAKSRPKRRVDVAGHQHQVRFLLREHRLEALEHARDLLGVAARPHPQHVVGIRHVQLLEEDVGHQSVVVLPGVDGCDPPLGKPPAHGRDHRRHLHDVRARPDYADDAHMGASVVEGSAGGREQGELLYLLPATCYLLDSLRQLEIVLGKPARGVIGD
jgi:hypothetical protein